MFNYAKLNVSSLNKIMRQFQYCTSDHPKIWFWGIFHQMCWEIKKKSKLCLYILKQTRPWSEGSYRSPLIWVWTVWKIQCGFSSAGYQIERALNFKGVHCLIICLIFISWLEVAALVYGYVLFGSFRVAHRGAARKIKRLVTSRFIHRRYLYRTVNRSPAGQPEKTNKTCL